MPPALLIAREELVLYLIVTLMMLYFAAVGIYYCEHEAQPEAFASIFHSLWWGVATLTTVGYGDIYPITTGGKIFTFVILLCGLGVVSVPTGIISPHCPRPEIWNSSFDVRAFRVSSHGDQFKKRGKPKETQSVAGC
ncbi:MAG: potassium channel family protein [Pirellulaceae bacterium]